MSDLVENAIGLLSLIFAGIVGIALLIVLRGGDLSSYLDVVNALLPPLVVGFLILIIVFSVFEALAGS